MNKENHTPTGAALFVVSISNQKHQGIMKKNEKMKGFLGEWLEKSGKITEVITFNKKRKSCLRK